MVSGANTATLEWDVKYMRNERRRLLAVFLSIACGRIKTRNTTAL